MLSSLILSFALLASSFLCPNCAHTEVSLLPPPGEIIIIKVDINHCTNSEYLEFVAPYDYFISNN